MNKNIILFFLHMGERDGIEVGKLCWTGGISFTLLFIQAKEIIVLKISHL